MDLTPMENEFEPALLFAGSVAEILIPAEATGGAFSLLRIRQAAGAFTPPHVHAREEETICVLSGRLHVESAGIERVLDPGQALMLPRNVPHRLGNRGDEVLEALLLCTPAGFEQFVRDTGESAPPHRLPRMPDEADRDRIMAHAPRFGITIVDEAALRP